jgi:hypothetical protein
MPGGAGHQARGADALAGCGGLGHPAVDQVVGLAKVLEQAVAIIGVRATERLVRSNSAAPMRRSGFLID